jgi:hypothetical protein
MPPGMRSSNIMTGYDPKYINWAIFWNCAKPREPSLFATLSLTHPRHAHTETTINICENKRGNCSCLPYSSCEYRLHNSIIYILLICFPSCRHDAEQSNPSSEFGTRSSHPIYLRLRLTSFEAFASTPAASKKFTTGSCP